MKNSWSPASNNSSWRNDNGSNSSWPPASNKSSWRNDNGGRRSPNQGRNSYPCRSVSESAEIEHVVQGAVAILQEEKGHSLRAVELANTLRAHVGTRALILVRERSGGLLATLERRPELFLVGLI